MRKLLLGIFIGLLGLVHAEALTVGSVLSKDPLKSKHPKELILLIHGLMRSYSSMSSLQTYLEGQGYEVYNYNYSSIKYKISEHGVHLRQDIEHLLREHPDYTLHFITHSLGGIIVREALGQLSVPQLNKIGVLIMLAPPNQGSTLARFLTSVFPLLSFFIKPLGELSTATQAYVHQVPVPKIKIAIIAGRFDLKVPPSLARLEGQRNFAVVNATHAFIMNHAQTKKLITQFLATGTPVS